MTAPADIDIVATVFTETFESADPQAVGRLGGKGAGLARMTQGGLTVPPGYIISTDACRHYLAADAVPNGLADEVAAQLRALERRSGKTFGRGPLPLLLSVRSGAPISMPGMMDTILNLGLGRQAAVDLAIACGDTRFVAELTARFHAMYSEIVLGALDAEEGVRDVVDRIGPDDPPGESYDRVWAAAQRALHEDCGQSVPAEPFDQLLGAIEAVFRSWNTRRARAYREFHGIADDLGTAVVVQSMVFGNLGPDSGSGVVFTRNPVTGAPGLFGEYLADCQGEDVVAGIRTPDPVASTLAAPLLAELTATGARLEAEYGDVLDIEFTVERGSLYFLQVRSAKRTPEAAVRIAADLLADGTLTPAAALRSVSTEQIRQVQRPGFDGAEVAAARAGDRVLTTGVGACPGQVSGVLMLDPDRAQAEAARGTPVVLARVITSPADLHGMIAARGIITATGGSTSHAAVVARALGTCCVVGAADMAIDEAARTLTAGGCMLTEGEPVSLDGGTGELFRGEFTTATPVAASAALSSLLSTASEAAGCEIFGKVSVTADAPAARAAGATGLLVSVHDILVAAGHFDAVVDELSRHAEQGGTGPLTAAADLVAAAFGPVLEMAGEMAVVVQGLDLLSDGPGRAPAAIDIVGRLPQLALSMGFDPLVGAQLQGLARATCAATAGSVHFLLPRVSDAAEASAVSALAKAIAAPVGAGVVLGCPRSLFHLDEIASNSDQAWIDLLAVQSAAFGIPTTALSATQPLDGYLERGLLGLDPRVALDPSVAAMLDRSAGSVWAGDHPGARRTGVRITGPISAGVIDDLYHLGARRFAVEIEEIRPLLLAVGRAANR